MDEVTGATVADAAGSNPGVDVGTPVHVPGEAGYALGFDGSSSFVAVQDNDLWAFGSSDFTIELWANFATSGGGGVGQGGDIFIGNDESSGTANKWFFALGGGYLYFHINGPGIGDQFIDLVPFTPEIGRWYHLAVRRSGSTYTIFIDGVAAGSAPNAVAIPNANAPLTIGEAEGFYMNGLLDEVTIYNRALTDTELNSIFQAGSAGKCKVLAVYTNSLSLGQIGQPYSRQLEALFGTAPLSWTVVAGALPNGITLSSDGLLSGTPNQGGISTFTVRVTDGGNATVDQTFTLEVLATLPPPVIRINKTGSIPVPGRNVDYYIVVENVGSTTVTDVPVLEAIDPSAFDLLSANPPPDGGIQDITAALVLLWTIPSLDPGQFQVLTYRAAVNASLALGTPVIGGPVCVGKTANDVTECLLEDLPSLPGDACQIFETLCIKTKCLAICKGETCLICLGPCVIGGGLCAQDIYNLYKKCEKAYEDVLGLCTEAPTVTQGPSDPNEKLVAAGQFIPLDQTLVYPVHFENDGTLAAIDVFATDVLDPGLDDSTLQILSAGGSYNPTTRTVSWSLLGRNLQPGESDAVLLSAKPHPGLPSGTEIHNTATIQFEALPPMVTNGVVNVIDTTPPTCMMQPLPATSSILSVPLSWSGTDMAGPVAGQIDTYSVFVSTNGGPYTAVLENTRETSTTFFGKTGNSYGFICIAKDVAGNVEVQQPTAEATTALTLADPAARACQQAIATAGAGYASARLKEIQTCRSNINRGTLSGVTPAMCSTQSGTASAIARAGRTARLTIQRKCTDAVLTSLAACGPTVDSLVSTDGSTGCLISDSATSVDNAVASEYGATLTPAQTAEDTCQRALASAGRAYMDKRLGAVQKCRSDLLAGKHLFLDRVHTQALTSIAGCANEYRASTKIQSAGLKARKTAAAACTDSLLAMIAPCATTLDGVVTSDGNGGCLITSHTQVVSDLLLAQYGQ